MKRLQIVKESILASLITLIITYGVSFIPFKYEYSKGIRIGFLGFDIYDLHYSKKHLKNPERDSSIVLVEIGNSRADIAQQIKLIEKHSPAVIGIDAVFERAGDTTEDAEFVKTINTFDNIVFGSRFEEDQTTRKKYFFVYNFFDSAGQHYPSGYINFIGDEFSVIRKYPPFIKTGQSRELSFTSAVATRFDTLLFKKFDARKKETEIINYKGNLESYNNILASQLNDYHRSDQLAGLLKGKIVLLGYFVKQPPLVLEDLHFSPLNEQVSGKSFPDMYGVVIHANILSMITCGCYANEEPEIVSYLLAGIIISLFLYYILSQYKGRKHPSHGRFMLVQFLTILIVLYVFLLIFDWFLIKFSLLPIMIAMVLCLELLGVYKSFALWLHKKYNYKTVFSQKLSV